MYPFEEVLHAGLREAPRYTIHYSYSERNSWICLPPSLAGQLLSSGAPLPLPCALRLQPPMGPSLEPPIFISWAGGTCSAGSVTIPARVAHLLDLPEGMQVMLTPLPSVPIAESVTVEPASPDDWEIIELNAGAVEDQLLAQTGVASTSQPLAVWVHNELLALNVTATSPSSNVIRLAQGTEVHIAPRLRANGTILEPDAWGAQAKRGADAGAAESAREAHAPVRTLLRLLVWEGPEETAADGGTAESNDDTIVALQGVLKAFVSPQTLQRCALSAGDWVEFHAKGGRSATAQLLEQPTLPLGHLGLSSADVATFGIEQFNAVQLRKLSSLERDVLSERLQVVSQKATDAPQTLATSSPWRSPIAPPFNKAASAPARQGTGLPAASKALAECSQDPLLQVLEKVLPVLASGPRSVLQAWGAPRPGGVLIEGPPGSGKTALWRALGAVLQAHPQCLCAVEWVPCRELHSLADAKARIDASLGGALDKLPALLVFDDLEVLCPGSSGAPEHEAGQPEDGGAVNFLCDVLDTLAAAQSKWLLQGWTPPPGRAGCGSWAPLMVVATCREAANVPPALREVGRFESVVSLEPPSAKSRAAMLAAGVKLRGAVADPAALHAAASHADGFDGADLAVLLDRAVSRAVSRQLRCDPGVGGPALEIPLRLRAEDLEEAAAGMVPAAFWGAGTRTSVQAGVEGWGDVGGLDTVREALQEAIELPLKYPNLVAQAPLRLRTGVLLYGPPGCGKTHIVAAAVAASGVRCITVSGPELLNKYIGASEAAVRDVFRRAAAAAPSILFFDEFDAIAPQRGHDNTGVSDRVVNQLLTELDGVEGLRGVSVIAATSRPDLLDAALLRPGRLDRMLYCGFPSPTERRDVLRSLSRRLTLGEDVDLDAIAQQTEFFSGADLGALLSEAQLAAAHEALQQKEGASWRRDDAPSGGGVQILQRHLEAAVASARPSVSEAERQRLADIYLRFEGGPSQGATLSAADKGKGKKVTWA